MSSSLVRLYPPHRLGTAGRGRAEQSRAAFPVTHYKRREFVDLYMLLTYIILLIFRRDPFRVAQGGKSCLFQAIQTTRSMNKKPDFSISLVMYIITQ